MGVVSYDIIRRKGSNQISEEENLVDTTRIIRKLNFLLLLTKLFYEKEENFSEN